MRKSNSGFSRYSTTRDIEDPNMLMHQLIKYSIVGLVSNGVLYLAYLLITKAGIPPKSAMTICYAVGVIQTFFFNRSWTFRSEGSIEGTAKKYVATYISGYFLNLIILLLFVDYLGVPHQLVQGVAILIITLYLFLCQRYWVFRSV